MWAFTFIVTFVLVFVTGIEVQDQGAIVISNRDAFLHYFDSIFHWEVKESGPVFGLPLEPATEYFFLTAAGGQDDDGSELDRYYFTFQFLIEKHICDVTSMNISIKYCNFDTSTWIYPTPVENGDEFHTLKSHEVFAWDYEQFTLDHTYGEVKVSTNSFPCI